MKKILLLILPVCFLFFNCSEKEDENPEIDDQFKIFKQDNANIGKVMQGTDGIYEFKAFGYFQPTADPAVFIPKNIKFIEQKLIATGETFVLKLDENYLPQVFYKTNNLSIEGYTYHIYHSPAETIVNHDMMNEVGQYITSTVTVLPGITLPNGRAIPSSQKRNNEANCNDALNEQNELHPCSSSNIYKEYADSWKSHTEGTVISHVGAAVSWIVNTSIAKICNQPNGRLSSSSEGLSCSDYEEDDEDNNVCMILATCSNDCEEVLFGSSYSDVCGTCVGGTTGNLPLTTVWSAHQDEEGCWVFSAVIRGGTGPYQYNWSNGGNDSVTTICSPPVGSVGSITINDAAGCTATSSWVFVN